MKFILLDTVTLYRIQVQSSFGTSTILDCTLANFIPDKIESQIQYSLQTLPVQQESREVLFYVNYMIKWCKKTIQTTHNFWRNGPWIISAHIILKNTLLSTILQKFAHKTSLFLQLFLCICNFNLFLYISPVVQFYWVASMTMAYVVVNQFITGASHFHYDYFLLLVIFILLVANRTDSNFLWLQALLSWNLQPSWC